MATMDQTNEGTAGSKPFKEAFAFYPGCGLINEFGGNASAPDTVAATLDAGSATWSRFSAIDFHPFSRSTS